MSALHLPQPNLADVDFEPKEEQLREIAEGAWAAAEVKLQQGQAALCAPAGRV